MGSNASKPPNYEPHGYGLLITFLVITTVSTVARVTSRRLQKQRFGADDILAYVACLSNFASLINLIIVVSTGVFNFERFMLFTPAAIDKFQKQNLASAVLYVVTLTTAKLSILFLFRRIFYVYTGWYRVFWWFNVAFIFPGWSFATMGILIYGQVDKFSYGGAANVWGTPAVTLANAVSDVLVIILPIRGVISLQLPRSQKIGVIGLFSLGLMTTMVSLTRASLAFYQAIRGATGWNASYEAYNFITLAAAETSASVMCACIPVARPFFLKAVNVASRSLNVSSLRNLISRSNLSSSQATQPNPYTPDSTEVHKSNISRTVDIDMDSVPLRKNSSGEQSVERANVLGYNDQHETPATARAWA